MDNLPLALIEAVNSALYEGKLLTWRIHGGDDKIMMNIMWTRTKKAPTIRPVKPLHIVSNVLIEDVTGHSLIRMHYNIVFDAQCHFHLLSVPRFLDLN